MSDLDDLLDDNAQEQIQTTRKQTILTKKPTALKSTSKRTEAKPTKIKVEDDPFEESKGPFDDDDSVTPKTKGDKSTKALDASKSKTVKKKVDKSKVNEKVFGKKPATDKSKFHSHAEALADDHFFKAQATPKNQEEKPDVNGNKEASSMSNIQQDQSEKDLSSKSSIMDSPKNEQILNQTEPTKETGNKAQPIIEVKPISIEPERTSSFTESAKLASSGNLSQRDTEKASMEQIPIKVENESPQVSPDSKRKELRNFQENNFNSFNSSSFQSTLSVETNFAHIEQRKSVGVTFNHDDANANANTRVPEVDERKEDNLDLDLLSAKTGSSLLKEQLPDVFVPGNQKIIRKRRDTLEKEAVKFINKTNNRKSQRKEDINKMNQSMIRLPETFVEKFEKEDYEAARPLGVDEFIKNFLVSENPSADQYSVPLTKLAPQVQVSNAFFLNVFSSTSPYGKPKTIRRISSNIIVVGTSNGLVCGFDTNKKIMIFKLGDTREGTYGSVTAMDYKEDTKFLVAGYENGNLVIFDITKRSVVKMISNSHEAAIIGLEIVTNEPLQYLSVDTAGVVMLNELERMMLLYNQESSCVFSQSAGLNFVQLEILNHKYPDFVKINKSGDDEMLIAYASVQQIVITTLEPTSKTKRVLLKYPRPPIVYEGAIPHICWYQRSPLMRIPLAEKDFYFDERRLKSMADANGTSPIKEISVCKYWLLMGWGFCVFLVEMRVVENIQIDFEEIGYIKFGAEIIHLQLIDKNVLMIMDASHFIHLIHLDEFTCNQDFYLPSGNKSENIKEEVRLYSEYLDFGEGTEIVNQTSFYFKEPSGKFKKVYHNSIRTDWNEKETLIVHNKAIYSLKLNSWNNILDETESQNNWLKLFTISLALYHNTIKEVYQIQDDNARKEILRDYFKDKLRRFVTSQVMGKQKSDSAAQNCFIEEVTLTLIDFCLEARMENFLFTDAKLCLETFGFKDVFFKSLEPFIRWNKIHIFPSLAPLQEVIDFFLKKGKVSVTQQLIANLDMERWNEDEREVFLLSLMTIILEKNLFTALPYVCIKGTQNFTLPFFTFLNSAFDADRRGDTAKHKEYILRCLWFIKTIFKRKVAFMDELISEEKTKEILKDLVLLFMEEAHLEKFYNVEPVLTTVLIGMLFTGELSLFLEDFYGQIPLFEIITEPELKDNLHFQMLNRIDRFYEKYFTASVEQERLRRQAFFAFILSKVVEEQKHKFLAESICKDSAKYLMKHHSQIDELIILDYKINPLDSDGEPITSRYGIVHEIPEDFLTEKKGTMIERMLMYARTPLSNPEIVNELIGLATFTEPLCYLLSIKKEYEKCLTKYLDFYTPQKTKTKAIQWIITTIKQLLANKDDSIERFKKAVLDKVGELVIIDSDKMTNFIKNYFKKEEIKTAINKLSNTADVQLLFVESFISEAQGSNRVDDDIIEVFVRLLAESGDKQKQKRILPELQKLGRYPPKCVDVCRKNNIKDAAAFLEEMRGNKEGIKMAIELRLEILQEYLKKCVDKMRVRLSPKQEKKIQDKFISISATIKIHFPDNNELWFDIMERALRGEELIYHDPDYKTKQENFKEIFHDIFEKTFVDEMLECLNFEVILSELCHRAWKIPSLIIKKFLTKMLRENTFEEKFSVSALETLKTEILSLVNVNVIPYEVKGVATKGSCSFCGQGFEYESGLLFACGHIYHTKHSLSKSTESVCEICSANDGVIATKIFEAKLKKLSNQPQNRYDDQRGRNERAEEVEIPKRGRKESTTNNNTNNNKAMLSIKIETRLNAIERTKTKLTAEVNDLVYKYQVL